MQEPDPNLNGNEEQAKVKKLIRDRVWALRKEFSDRTKTPALLKNGNLVVYSQAYVLALEQNYIVQDVLIEAAGLSKKRTQEILAKAGIPQKFIGG